MAETINEYIQDTQKCITLYTLRIAIIAKREELGLSIRELSKKAGINYNILYNFEFRGIIPKVETLFKIANALGMVLNITLCEPTSRTINVALPYEEIQQNLFIMGLDDNDIKEVMHFIEVKLG